MDKIIFLDIDGVLNSSRSVVAYGGYPYPNGNWRKFDQIALKLIRIVCNRTGAKIVLSSTWRLHVDPVEFGEKLKLPIIDKTCQLFGSRRGQEIQSWLDENKCDRYVIIDDYPDMLESQKDNTIVVDNFDGLSYKNYLSILKILGEEDE
jgi:hypothetical protein